MILNDENKLKIGFELFDHTADIGVHAFGERIADVFEQAARSMYSIIFHGSVPIIKPKGEFQIKIQSSDLEQLMVDWLNEILYIYSTENIVISGFQIEINKEEFLINAFVEGEKLSNQLLKGTGEIKAVTYHMLEVKNIDNHWEAKVLFDI
jgi:SHS2 domain-containing protein